MGRYLDRINSFNPTFFRNSFVTGETAKTETESISYDSSRVITSYNSYVRAREKDKAAKPSTEGLDPALRNKRNKRTNSENPRVSAGLGPIGEVRNNPGELRNNSDPVPPPDWWRDEFEERAAIREYDGHYTRAEAERLAWGELQCRWHKLRGERVPADICAGCRRPIGARPALDVADGSRVHDGPDHVCLIEFGKRRRGAASQALIEMGLTPPTPDASEVC